MKCCDDCTKSWAFRYLSWRMNDEQMDDDSKARPANIDVNFFDRVIYPNLVANDSKVILPPQH